MSRIKELANIGQSIWYDYIRRSFLTSGELESLIEEGLRGETSNPSILAKAIDGSADYDDELAQLAEQGKSVREIYEELVLEDIGHAADLFKPVYDETDGLDGYVSIEVDPKLAHDTDGTVAESRRLFEKLNRPNIMIKVPATKEGIPAITELISSGVNVNVTLMFSLGHYKSVSEAYLKGLEKLAQKGPSVKNGHTIEKVSSVASFFVSRVDTAVDTELEKIGNRELKGKIAVDNARVVYKHFKEVFSGKRWEKLSQIGAGVQRLLWASTSTKNPLYPDTKYVDELIGPHTVNTVPPSTYRNFMDHGTVNVTVTKGVGQALDNLSKLKDLGIDLNAITEKLQDDGVDSFAGSFEKLMRSIEEKKSRLSSGETEWSANLGDYETDVKTALERLRDEEIIKRIWSCDFKVWKNSPEEITNRLGWLHVPEHMQESVDEINSFVNDVRESGYTNAVLLGMGGSSLAPEVFRLTFGVREGYLDLSVLDSTDPGAVLEIGRSIDLSKTLFIISSKSGSTIETISFMKYFYNEVLDKVGSNDAGRHFIAITDPGSSLVSIAQKLDFRKIFLNDPTIGGRYSALSHFGLVPAGLIGLDLELILDRSLKKLHNNESCNCPVKGDNSGAWLGSVLGVIANSGRDKLTIVTSPRISHFGSWLEQLVAESTGKEGKGILPVDGEVLASPDSYANDRLFVYLKLKDNNVYDEKIAELEDGGHPVVRLNLNDLYDLGGEFYRWEMAIAVAGMFLGINPFDQPNVEAAKKLAGKMVDKYINDGKLPEPGAALKVDGIKIYSDLDIKDINNALPSFMNNAESGNESGKGRSYVAIQAYLKPDNETNETIEHLRKNIQTRYRLATTFGYGPRYLHSTGQLHKGDAGKGLFIQFMSDINEDVAIPDEPGEKSSSISFGVLKNAQILGDRQALLESGRKVITFNLGNDVTGGLKKLIRSVK